ncbi:MAG: hypothetical protein ABSC63_04420 [Candidatus Binataceae bacterium]|jgi:hypothetical protein
MALLSKNIHPAERIGLEISAPDKTGFAAKLMERKAIEDVNMAWRFEAAPIAVEIVTFSDFAVRLDHREPAARA